MLSKEFVLQTLKNAKENDVSLMKFGANYHQYELYNTLEEGYLDKIEESFNIILPKDYKFFLTNIASSGAGPGYGLVPIYHESQLNSYLSQEFISPTVSVIRDRNQNILSKGHSNFTPNCEGMIMLADYGCCKTALLVVSGEQYGSVYYDMRGINEGFVFAFDSFNDWYYDWLISLNDSNPIISELLGDPKLCALPDLLSNLKKDYAKRYKENESAFVSDEELGEYLCSFEDNTIQTFADVGRFYGEQTIRLCPSCNKLINDNIEKGWMRRSLFDPGMPSLPEMVYYQSQEVEDEDPILIPNCPIGRLSEYVAFIKEVQKGDMMGALSRRGLSITDYSNIALEWSQLMSNNSEVLRKYTELIV